jgi:hypothetical protein
MSTQYSHLVRNNSKRSDNEVRHRWMAGVALIAIGVLVLVVQFADSEALGLLFLPGLGLIFLIWGMAVRSVGLLIPGGILGGIGLGVYLMAGPLSGLEGEAEGAVFFLSFAGGWVLITLLSGLVCREAHWWPLIPGGIMALIGGALLAGGPALTALNWAGKSWPLIPIGFGLYLLLRRHTAVGDDKGEGSNTQ